jgi:hypothetical protein
MKRPTQITSKKANRLFLLCVTLASILITAIAAAQDRYSINITTDNMMFRSHLFYGGVEFDAEFSNNIYVRPQIHYADLKDGYLETSAGIGYRLPLERLSLKSGVKLGFIKRASSYPLLGIEGAIEYLITDKISLGLRGSYDKRGDADFYEGKDMVWNSQGYIKFGLNF